MSAEFRKQALHRSFKRALYVRLDSTGKEPMNTRSTFYLAAGSAFVAALALALAVVATMRARDNGDAATSHMMGGSTMSGGMEHGAAASQEGVPNATAAR